MFLLLTFPLANKIKSCVAIYKLVSLKFRYSTYFLLSNWYFTFLKHQTLKLKFLKSKIVESTCAIIGPTYYGSTQLQQVLVDGNHIWQNENSQYGWC